MMMMMNGKDLTQWHFTYLYETQGASFNNFTQYEEDINDDDDNDDGIGKKLWSGLELGGRRELINYLTSWNIYIYTYTLYLYV